MLAELAEGGAGLGVGTAKLFEAIALLGLGVAEVEAFIVGMDEDATAVFDDEGAL